MVFFKSVFGIGYHAEVREGTRVLSVQERDVARFGEAANRNGAIQHSRRHLLTVAVAEVIFPLRFGIAAMALMEHRRFAAT